LFVPHDHRIQKAELLVGEVVLFQYRHAGSLADMDLSAVVTDFAGKDSQEGGFSGPVGPDYAIAVARSEF
jgi:hypothetical protein